ncbi:hypothetical protein ACIOTN_17695 [Glutamicibacter sp. NPDC087661]|uniref:hypothetical protein n=1 Tax=Glutamicibacter sp. NPDC087661 TaxID=3363996 RepID=UPI0037F55D33
MSNVSGGKPSASVYRRRRITVAVLALVLVGLLVWGVVALAGLFSPDEKKTADNEPSAQQTQSVPSPSPEPEDDEAAAKKCKSDEVEITATTDAKSYASDKKPTLLLGIENVSKRECELNVGTTQQEFLVSSGADRIFSTIDCLDGAEDVNLAFKPGQKENARFTWNRERSAPGCKSVSVQPRPGTYKFTAAIGDFVSEPVTFTLE